MSVFLFLYNTDMTIPSFVQKYFWGDDLSNLNWRDHKKYITQTILDRGDSNSVSWLFKKTSREELLQQIPKLRLSPKSRNFWSLYLS